MNESYFLGALTLTQCGYYWCLRKPLTYKSGTCEVYVPDGFMTDFASVPRFLWNLFPPTDPRYSAIAIVHDRLYETHQLTRKDADRLFRDGMAAAAQLMGEDAIGPLVRYLMWAAVRIGGRSAYRSGPIRQWARLDEYARRFPDLAVCST